SPGPYRHPQSLRPSWLRVVLTVRAPAPLLGLSQRLADVLFASATAPVARGALCAARSERHPWLSRARAAREMSRSKDESRHASFLAWSHQQVPLLPMHPLR